MDHYYLDFERMSKMFYVADSVLKKFKKAKKTPILELSMHDYHALGCISPDYNVPIVGILAERSEDCYAVKSNDILPLAEIGVRIRLLTYEHCAQQLTDCSGLVLTGENFVFPKRYFADYWRHEKTVLAPRTQAALLCLHHALKLQIPIMGIGGGALVIAGEMGLKLYPNIESIETPIEHLTDKKEAHRLNVFPSTPLSRLLDGQNMMFVSSHHVEILAPKRLQYMLLAEERHMDIEKVVLPLDIYAEANDGVPEAWGDDKMHIFCIQWQPTNVALSHSIYQWLAEKIAILR